jgi:hypothetical protein
MVTWQAQNTGVRIPVDAAITAFTILGLRNFMMEHKVGQ